MPVTKLTMVMNLSTEKKIYYSLPAEDAVMAAYAQEEKRDWDTWQYEKYQPLRRYGQCTVSCGDWCAINSKEE